MARIIATFLMLLTVNSVVVLAEETKGDFEFGAYAGYAFTDNYGECPTALKPDDDLLYGARFGYFFTETWSAEASFQRLSTEALGPAPIPVSDFEIDSVRGNALYNFWPARRLRPFATLGVGLERTRLPNGPAKFSSSDPSVNLGGGLRWFLAGGFGLRFDVRYVTNEVNVLPNSVRPNNFETSLGALIAFGGGPPKDDDGDGVPNRKDNCPDTPRGARVDLDGCPGDTDGDGVFDGIDECPDTPAGAVVDSKGCPIDSDGDGVPDGIDQCPDTPAGATVDAKGCPIDSDGDGVPDGIDQCPDTPAGATVDAKGCPIDSDGDGVPDGIDKCPDTPAGARVDSRGCPLDGDGDGVPDGIDKCPDTPQGITVDEFGCRVLFEAERQALLLEGVKFKLNKDELTLDAKAILDRVAGSLVNYPEIEVEVVGYTDSSGADSYNLELSQRRAESVVNYLVSQGVKPDQLTAIGMGEADPVADNATAEGRERNRRVVLRKK
jgi:outer membrane protein OmpA-like peptidoglycan-associated protein